MTYFAPLRVPAPLDTEPVSLFTFLKRIVTGSVSGVSDISHVTVSEPVIVTDSTESLIRNPLGAPVSF